MVHIRVATTTDAEGIREVYAPYVLSTPTSFDIDVPTVEEFRNSIESRLHRYPWLVAEEERRIVGYAYASEHHSRRAYRWSVEVSVYLAESHQRRGLGTELYNRLFPILKKQGFRMAHAGVTLPNAGSVRLHESFGFKQIALYPNVGYKCGGWRDVGWWALDLFDAGGGNSIPTEPIDFPVLDPPEWEQKSS